MIVLAQDGALTLDVSKPATMQDRILLSLATPRGSILVRPTFGSELHLLRRSKADAVLPGRAVSMVNRSLQWMVDQGQLWDLAVSADLPARSRLRILISATSTEGQVRMDYWIPVPEAA